MSVGCFLRSALCNAGIRPKVYAASMSRSSSGVGVLSYHDVFGVPPLLFRHGRACRFRSMYDVLAGTVEVRALPEGGPEQHCVVRAVH